MTDLDLGPDLRDLMDRSLTDLAVPTDRLHDGSVRRGRAARRRRRVATAAGALAAATVAAALVVPSLAGSDPTGPQVAHDTDDGPPYVRPPGWWNMPGDVMLGRLGELLPPHVGTADPNLGDEELAPGDVALGGWIQVDLRDRRDRPAGGVNVILYPPPSGEDTDAWTAQMTTCPVDFDDGVDGTCTEVHDEAGVPVGHVTRSKVEGVVVLEVTQLTPSGGILYGSVSNSSDEKWGRGSSVDRAEPLLDEAELTAIVLSPTWRGWSDAGA